MFFLFICVYDIFVNGMQIFFNRYVFRNAKPKTAAQLKKEAKKKEKMEKFMAKKQKMEQIKATEVFFIMSELVWKLFVLAPEC